MKRSLSELAMICLARTLVGGIIGAEYFGAKGGGPIKKPCGTISVSPMRVPSNSLPYDHGYGKRSSLSSAKVGQLKSMDQSVVRICAETLNGIGG
jgi:hypothetical protein